MASPITLRTCLNNVFWFLQTWALPTTQVSVDVVYSKAKCLWWAGVLRSAVQPRSLSEASPTLLRWVLTLRLPFTFSLVTLLVLCFGCTKGQADQLPTSPGELVFPVRAAFYYPWFPETWSVNGKDVFYNPTLSYYDSSTQAVVDAHINALTYAKVQVGIASWWGVSTHKESERIPLLLNRTQTLNAPLEWALYYEKEGNNNPSVGELQNDLAYIEASYATSPIYAKVGGKPVLFVYNANDSSCEVVNRWAEATAGQWYIVLKVFPDYKTCLKQPDAWHQYAPAVAADQQKGYSYTISPGFWRADEPLARLERDLARWQQNVRDMVASGEPWQLITTFNEWGEGTATEAAKEWGEAYLDVLAKISPVQSQ